LREGEGGGWYADAGDCADEGAADEGATVEETPLRELLQ